MPRLIDADKITYTPSVPIAVISQIVNAGREEDAKHLFHVSRADIDAHPTIDAVPVIRCKDCKWYDTSKNGVNGFCRNLAIPFDSYEWCSRAERRGEE